MAKAKKKTMKLDVEVLFDLVKDGEVGQIYTYKWLMSHAPFNDTARIVREVGKERLQRAVGTCNEALLEKNEFRLINVPGVGYKIGTPAEQIIEVERRKRRSHKQVKRGMYELAYVNKETATLADLNTQEELLTLLHDVQEQFTAKKHRKMTQESLREVEKIARDYCGGF